MKHLLFTNVGKRVALLRNVKQSLRDRIKIIGTDSWSVAPALLETDAAFLSPRTESEEYMNFLFSLCETETIDGITSLMDPDISRLAKWRDFFQKKGILCFFPDFPSAENCLDKYRMYQYLKEKGLDTIESYDSLEAFEKAYLEKRVAFPVFIKPRSGSGSVGAQRVHSLEELRILWKLQTKPYLIQPYYSGRDIDADVYVDAWSGEVVSIFLKEKIERMIGGTSKAISIYDEKLEQRIIDVCRHFSFCGPVDLEFLLTDGRMLLYDINPRFSGAYLHAFACGIDFPEMMWNNMNGKTNPKAFRAYSEGEIMMLYPDILMMSESKLKRSYME